MSKTYKPIEASFHEVLEALLTSKAYVRVQYFSDLHEFFTTSALIKDLYFKENEEFIHLSTGEDIRLDRIVRVGNTPAPGYDEDYFKCDC